jgi:hypothetical protein
MVKHLINQPPTPKPQPRIKDEHIEEIRQHIETRGEYPLSAPHERIYRRLESMWRVRCNTSETFKNRTQIIFEHSQDYDISEALAQKDWDDCITLYRNYTNIDPNTELYISILRYDELINEARQAGKIEAALQAMKSRAELVSKLQPDPNKPDYTKQAPQVTALVVDDFTRILFEKAHNRMGDPQFYQDFLKLVLDIDDPLTFDFKTFLDSSLKTAETIDFENI